MAKVWRYSVIFTEGLNGALCIANVHYQTDVPLVGSEPSADEVLEQIDQHYSSTGRNVLKWRNVADNNTELVETRVYEEVDPGSGDAPEGASFVHNLAGTTGSYTTDVLPPEMCAYISLRTGKLGRSFRGGTHTPPITHPSDLDGNGKLQSGTGFFIGCQDLRDAIIDKLEDVFSTTGDINPIIYSRTRRSRGLSFAEELSGGLVRTNPRWIRRRTSVP